MRLVVQRALRAEVLVDQKVAGSIGRGLVALVGICTEDAEADANRLANKLVHLRLFPDAADKMNLSLLDSGGELLIVSQFTLYADSAQGNRPSFRQAAKPEVARPLYNYFVALCRNYGVKVETGIFQAHMVVNISNEGPVTIILDSKS